MTLDKTHFIVFIMGALLGLACGFFTGKAIYDVPESVKVERDTVVTHDTVAQYYPKPVEVERTRTEYKWLTRVMTDTLVKTDVITCHDSVLVEVPITSKHYRALEYDAWVSGYEPSLDSIKVYQEKEYITEKITVTKTKRKPWGVGLQVGYGYDFRTKTAAPFVGVGISYDIISF